MTLAPAQMPMMAAPVIALNATMFMIEMAGGQLAGLEVIGRVPDESIRPLVDALIVQELAPNVAPKDCWKIERVVEALAPIDPEIAGTLLGTVAGVLQPKELPMCKASAR